MRSCVKGACINHVFLSPVLRVEGNYGLTRKACLSQHWPMRPLALGRLLAECPLSPLDLWLGASTDVGVGVAWSNNAFG